MASSDGSSSGGSFLGGLIGGVIGFFVGGPGGAWAGAKTGFLWGTTIGGLLMPATGPDQFGPRLDSLTITTSSNVATRPRSYGTVAHRGNLTWAKDSEYIEVVTTKKVKTGLFSKTKVTTYTYFFTGAYTFARTEVSAVLRIWHAGGRDLVYNATSTDTDTQVASGDLAKYITIYYGTADQMPDPLISEDVGEASCSAYRGDFYIVYNMYPLADYQNNVGNLDPLVEYTTKNVTAADLGHLVDIPADDADSEQDIHEGLHNVTNLDADGAHLWRIGKCISEQYTRNYTETGERYHYLAQPNGELLLKQVYEDSSIELVGSEQQWHPYTKACHGKSDRNVFVSTKGYIKSGGPGDGGSTAHPALLMPMQVTAIGLNGGPTDNFDNVYDALEWMVAVSGYNYIFQTPGAQVSQQLWFPETGFLWKNYPIPGFSGWNLVISDPYFVIPHPITSAMFSGDEGNFFVRFVVRILDVDNSTDNEYKIHVDASEEMPNENTFYAFYDDVLYFLYTYSNRYVIVKIDQDGNRTAGGNTLPASSSIKKFGLHNEQLIVVIKNVNVCNLDLFDLDVDFVERLDSANVVALFGDSDSDLYLNISPDDDKIYHCLAGHMYSKDSLDATAVDMGLHTGLILATDSVLARPPLIPFNLFSFGNFIAAYVTGGTMPNLGVQFFTYGVVTDPSKVLLADIITAECALVGLDEDDIDVTTIDQEVRGYTVSEIGPVRNVLSQLQSVFPFDVIQSGYKLKFVKRGLTSVADVSWEDLGKEVSLVQDREMETQLPFRVELTYIDKDLNYQPNLQFSERQSDSKNITRLNIPVVFNPDEAAQASDTLQSIYYMERRSFVFTLPPTYRNLEPSDIITLQMQDVEYVVRLTNIHYLANGSMECAAKLHDHVTYESYAVGATSPTIPDTIPSVANPILGVLDIPVITPTQNKPGYTALASHPSANWVGGTLYRSRDGSIWEMVRSLSQSSVWGTCSSALSEHRGHLFDRGGSLTVRPITGIMPTFTREQMLNEESLLAYGAPGRWEIIAYQNSTDNGNSTYTIDTFMRGMRGTEWATGLHEVGDYFGFINDGKSVFVGALTSDIDKVLTHKAITTGRDLDTASVSPLTYLGENLNPLSPSRITAQIIEGDIIFTCVRRDRVNAGWWDFSEIPMSEADESYEWYIYDDVDNPSIRTLTSTGPTVTYTEAQQTADFGSPVTNANVSVGQISAAMGVGRIYGPVLVSPQSLLKQSSRWRINILSNNGHSNTSIAEIKFYDYDGVEISTVGGTPDASSFFSSPSFLADKAFDSNTATRWATSASPSYPQWIEMEFTAPVTVCSFSLTSQSGFTDDMPSDFEIQFEEGAGLVTMASYENETFVVSEPRTFQVQ